VTGSLRWHVEVGESVSFQPAVMNGRVYLATDHGAVFNLDARDPKATGWAMWGGNARHNGWTQ
jgi:outer membrane protein assembly factor BamB